MKTETFVLIRSKDSNENNASVTQNYVDNTFDANLSDS